MHIVFSQLESHFSTFEFFLLGKSLDFEIRNQNFHTRRSAGDVSDAYWMSAGGVFPDKINAAFTGSRRRKSDLQAFRAVYI